MNDNRLIAEFMELPKVPCNIGTEDGHFTEGYKHPKIDVPIIPSGMQYKYSWDWLMPVVETCYHNGAEEQEIGDITHALLDCDMKNLYKAVVEFIKEFNLKS